ncbi:MAG: peptidylprolyl isomerase [Ignavibacteria bacterium]|jgi:cyclophilin family peptidyl-prolyl cis-trans isomerase
MKNLFIVLFFAILLVWGCGNKNNDLIKTSFTRSFDKEILKSYLDSNNPELIKQALLSVSHSEDTTFIPLIISLSFNDYPEMICFALGQIRPCHISTQFLWEKVGTSAENSGFIFEAIGKTGSESDLSKICDMYTNSDEQTSQYNGISLAIRQFAFRGITSESAVQVLVDEVNNPSNSIQNKNYALFTLARTGGSDKINKELIRILLIPETNNPDTIKLKQYSLMNFRTQQFFSYDESVLRNVLSESNVLLRIEAARSLCYRKIKTSTDVDLYLELIEDENPNVSRAAANSISNLNVESERLKTYLKEKIEMILNQKLTPHTYGELLFSYSELYNPAISFLESYFQSDRSIPSSYWYNFLGTFKENSEALSKLSNEYNSSNNLKNQISILSNLLGFQTNYPSNPDLYNLLVANLSSPRVPIAVITADGIDSLFIAKENELIKDKIRNTVTDQINNPEYAEGIMYLINLAERIESEFYFEMIDIAIKSGIYSVRKYISEKEGLTNIGEKPSEHLDEILENSFNYKFAVIKTEKGNFIIEFLPEYAPVSVGNFCTLAKKKFYDGVQFHRVVPGFVIQCGDTSGTGWGGPGYEIVCETSPINYEVGFVGMASAGKDTEGSQWFVMQGNYPHLNGRYTVFAEVIDGMEVVYNIDQDDKIIEIELKN